MPKVFINEHILSGETIMLYPLEEKIGNPDLLVGREKEFTLFGKWIDYIPKRLSKSRVILARRKSGKTAFVQRIFNQLWNANGEVIPFYLDIGEQKFWYRDFAIEYFCVFASQYISFLERDAELIRKPLTLEKIRDYGVKKSIKLLVDDVNEIFENDKMGSYDIMWKRASEAPHRYASILDISFLIILDEFQNLSRYIYPDPEFKTDPIETMPGSFHSLSESKVAPMLVTGSYVGWLIEISGKYLQAGRLSKIRLSPYLTSEEGLQAVLKYAEVYNEPITNDSAILINQLCMSDPFFISCVIKSTYEHRDLTTDEGVINTVNYEISDRDSEMSETWREYIELTLQRINDIHAKNILLHLSKHSDREWTPKEIKDALSLDISINEIQKRLQLMVESDVIGQGVADIDYQGLKDGTLNLILRNRFEKEIKGFPPELKKEFHEQIAVLKKDKHRLQGMLNNLMGMFAEYQLANELRSRKRFTLSEFFSGVKDNRELNIIDVKERVKFQRENGKAMEIDVRAESSCGRVALVEVRKTKAKVGIKAVEDFYEKVALYEKNYPESIVLPAFLSVGGFTDEAIEFCQAKAIGRAETIKWHFMFD